MKEIIAGTNPIHQPGAACPVVDFLQQAAQSPVCYYSWRFWQKYFLRGLK
jgi:hypothetical protein